MEVVKNTQQYLRTFQYHIWHECLKQQIFDLWKTVRVTKVVHACSIYTCTWCGMPVITGCPLVGAPAPPAFGRLFRWVFGLLFPPGPLGDWSEEFGVSAFPSSFNWLQYTHEHYASGLEKVHPQRKTMDTTPTPNSFRKNCTFNMWNIWNSLTMNINSVVLWQDTM